MHEQLQLHRLSDKQKVDQCRTICPWRSPKRSRLRPSNASTMPRAAASWSPVLLLSLTCLRNTTLPGVNGFTPAKPPGDMDPDVEAEDAKEMEETEAKPAYETEDEEAHDEWIAKMEAT